MARTVAQIVAILLLCSAVGLVSNSFRADGISLRPPVEPTTTKVEDGPKTNPDVVTIDEVLKHFRANDARFVDAREAEKFVLGHIKGSINLPSTSVYQDIDRVTNFVAPMELVIVYCGGGECEASHTVADVLKRERSFTNVKIYVKGWEELERSPNLAELTEAGSQ